MAAILDSAPIRCTNEEGFISEFSSRLSVFLDIIFMDRISRCNQGLEGVQFGKHRISADCEVAGLRISSSKSKASTGKGWLNLPKFLRGLATTRGFVHRSEADGASGG